MTGRLTSLQDSETNYKANPLLSCSPDQRVTPEPGSEPLTAFCEKKARAEIRMNKSFNLLL